jgi:hypothetical protein
MKMQGRREILTSFFFGLHYQTVLGNCSPLLYLAPYEVYTVCAKKTTKITERSRGD